jgi:hypothetical protein
MGIDKQPLAAPGAHGTAPARWLAAATLAAAFAAPGPACATTPFEFTGNKTLTAVMADGRRIQIGSVLFTPTEGGKAGFRLTLKPEAFSDHFLSMREFKCLPGGPEISCHVPYPYRHPATVGPGDVAWLEHSLLFLYKTPAEFGAKLWNGVMYEMRLQGAALVGTPKAVDLNEISAPPNPLSVPPFGSARRHDLPAEARWLRRLVIE